MTSVPISPLPKIVGMQFGNLFLLHISLISFEVLLQPVKTENESEEDFNLQAIGRLHEIYNYQELIVQHENSSFFVEKLLRLFKNTATTIV